MLLTSAGQQDDKRQDSGWELLYCRVTCEAQRDVPTRAVHTNIQYMCDTHRSFGSTHFQQMAHVPLLYVSSGTSPA